MASLSVGPYVGMPCAAVIDCGIDGTMACDMDPASTTAYTCVAMGGGNHTAMAGICSVADHMAMAAMGENLDMSALSADCLSCLIGDDEIGGDGSVCMPNVVGNHTGGAGPSSPCTYAATLAGTCTYSGEYV